MHFQINTPLTTTIAISLHIMVLFCLLCFLFPIIVMAI